MELDELKTNWKTVNNRLDEMQTVQIAMQKTIMKGHGKKVANHLMRQPIFELIVGGATALWIGNFLAVNFAKIQQSPVGAAPALVIDALAILTIWLSIRQLAIIGELDYSKPIVETQEKVALLRTLKVRVTQISFLSLLPLWMIFPIVAGQALFGFDFMRAVSVPWILTNIAFGVGMSLGIIAAARKYGERTRFFQKINDLLAGKEIVEAQAELEELRGFQRS